ncbi:MAG: hypothetical protein JSV73_02355 [Flavobacteriaceae bacterium]|nr:MAG: hypothetical protein JSV73_02355 [Flavobacteriaceae bacterium]
MKNFTIKGLLLLTVIVLSSYSVPESFMGVKKILGEWDYTVPDASYEYQKGVLFLDKVDGELTGEVRIGGQGMALENIVFQKKNLKGDIYVQGEIVKLDLNFTKKTFEGTVTYSMGALKMNGTKK